MEKATDQQLLTGSYTLPHAEFGLAMIADDAIAQEGGQTIGAQQPQAVGLASQSRLRRYFTAFWKQIELGILLAFVAGIVNTTAFMQFGTYVSHMSGHATRTAIEYIEGNAAAALIFILELLAFILGAVCTAYLLRGHTASYRRIKFTAPITLEAVSIGLYLLLDRLHGLSRIELDHMSLLPLLLAFAMGLQNAMLRHSSGAIIRTTHITGVVTDIGIELGAALHAASETFQSFEGHGRLRLWAVAASFWQRLGLGQFTFHSLLLLFFFLGATVGTVLYLSFLGAVLFVPFLILVALALQEYLRPLPKD